MVYVAWLVIFYYSSKCTDTQEFLHLIKNSKFLGNEGLIAFVSALPIGVIIHQLSVNIKNHIVAKLYSCEVLDDSPKRKYIRAIDDNTESTKYILEKISNLNSFYYTRFDNGFLAPFLALITVYSFGYKINTIAVIVAIVLGVLMLYYIPRICKEMKEYFGSINTKKERRRDVVRINRLYIGKNNSR